MTEPSELADKLAARLLGRKSVTVGPGLREEIEAAVAALRSVPAQEPVAWRYRWHAPDDALWESVTDKTMLPTDPIGWEIEPLYAAPVPPADLFAECAEIALEHVGAFNTNWTEESRMAYNQACRDIAMAITLRASNRKTMDAIADRDLRTASLSLD